MIFQQTPNARNSLESINEFLECYFSSKGNFSYLKIQSGTLPDKVLPHEIRKIIQTFEGYDSLFLRSDHNSGMEIYEGLIIKDDILWFINSHTFIPKPEDEIYSWEKTLEFITNSDNINDIKEKLASMSYNEKPVYSLTLLVQSKSL